MPSPTLAALLSTAPAALAGEGMWLPEQLPALGGALTEAGVALDPAALADLQGDIGGAVVSLGGCSASFVSPDGLLITNAHCVEGYLQQSSTAEVNRAAVGFTAPDRARELPAGPAARLYLVESLTDVTAQIDAVARDPKLPDAQRQAAVDRTTSQLVAKCERKAGRSCEVVRQFSGLTWQLIQRLELRDVRIVYAPPYDVAYFGGDLDNFEWPRHDGDVALLRAYVAPNGKPADPAPNNVPYRPPRWLPVSTDGVSEGDAVLVAGFPGQTTRWASADTLAFVHETVYPAELAQLVADEARIAEAIAADPAAANALQSTAADLANGRKYVRGVLDGLAGSTVVADKRAADAGLDGWIAAGPARAAIGAAVRDLRASVTAERDGFPRKFAVTGLLGASLLDAAHTAYRWSIERQVRKDADREPGLQDRDRDDLLAESDEVQPALWLPYERAVLAARFAAYEALPAASRIEALDAWLARMGGADKALDTLFAEPALAEPEARRALFGQPRAALEASTDPGVGPPDENPWVSLAVTLERSFLAESRAAAKARDGLRLRLEPVVAEAQRSSQIALPYPDANNTLRITFGKVRGYAPRDGLVAVPQTTLGGLVAKHRTPDYEAPAAVVAAAERTPTGPVNFLSDVDTTGGNSGSPTLDARGRLVGVVFDGNYESMAADWQFDPAVTRSIHVDVRFVLWLLALDPAASWIATELRGS